MKISKKAIKRIREQGLLELLRGKVVNNNSIPLKLSEILQLVQCNTKKKFKKLLKHFLNEQAKK